MTLVDKPEAQSSSEGVRSRSYEWRDPHAAAAEGLSLGGLGYLRAIKEGRLPPPPITATLDFALCDFGEGHAVFTCRPAEFHYNPLGTVHGGLALTLIDSAAGCAVHTVCPDGHGYTRLETKVNFVRPITRGTGALRCEGKVLHAGGRIATAEARVIDAAGKLYAHGTSTCLIFPLEKRSASGQKSG